MKLATSALLVILFTSPVLAAEKLRELTVAPAEVRLTDSRARQQLLVTVQDADGYLLDATRAAAFQSADPEIASVDGAGLVRPRRQGATVIRVQAHGLRAEVKVIVDDLARVRPVSFVNEVMAVVGRAGCNAGTCHGHNSGRGDFKLSLRGYNPSADHAAITDAGAGRVNVKEAAESLILQKPAGLQSHRGGKRFEVDSDFYKVLRQWLAEGAKADFGTPARLERIEVLPGSRVLPRTELQQQLVVLAHFAGGMVRDVTDLAIPELSLEGPITVTPHGLVTAQQEGESAVFVRFLGKMGLARFVVLRHKPDFRWVEPPVNNFIDKHIHTKLRAIQVLPSDLSSDTDFLRRVCLDTIGVPPRADEVRSFLKDTRSDKRQRKIDELLDREEFGDVWAQSWLELSGTTESGDSARGKGMWTLGLWLRDAINRNLPYDQFVRALLASRGSSLEMPGMTFGFNRLAKAEVVPQLFLGVRLQCAECHDHPFDVWKRDDYAALGTFFTDIKFKEGPHDTSGREGRVFVAPEKFLPWEQGKTIDLRLLDGSTVKAPIQRDRREVLVDWMFGPAKKLAARALVNRVWGKLLGRGIIDPVDDMRFSNPAVNEALLEALADDFIAHKYDFKHLVRVILSSRTYQLSSAANATNAGERMNFSKAMLRRLTAEQLLDSISLVTGVDEELRVGPPGIRAVQVPYEGAGSPFLTLFGRPGQRMSACECIRSREPTLTQLLHLLNGDTVGKKLRTDNGTLRRLLKARSEDTALIDDLYLNVLSRPPVERERRLALERLRAGTDRMQRAEDLMWALIASQEFLFNH